MRKLVSLTAALALLSTTCLVTPSFAAQGGNGNGNSGHSMSGGNNGNGNGNTGPGNQGSNGGSNGNAGGNNGGGNNGGGNNGGGNNGGGNNGGGNNGGGNNGGGNNGGGNTGGGNNGGGNTGGDKPPQDKPKQQQQQSQDKQSSTQKALGYAYFFGVCNLTGHFVDTFIVDRGQYRKDGANLGTLKQAQATHRKRTYGDQAAVFGNCIVPFIGGAVARQLQGSNRDQPLPFYTDDSWMFIGGGKGVQKY